MALTVDLPVYFSEKYPSDWSISGIYMIKSPTGSVYIGQSINIKRRFIKYKTGDCRYQTALFRSFSKHGIDSHMFSILKSVEENRFNTLTKLEQHYINLYRNRGFKMLNIKEAGSVGRLSDETKKKIGDGVRGNKNGNYGREFTKEHKDRLRESHLGQKAYWKGKSIPESAKKKISIAKTGVPAGPRSEETRRRISSALKGKYRKGLNNLKAITLSNDLGEHYEFRSIRSAMSFVGLKGNKVYRIVNTNEIYGGFYWKLK